MTPLGKGYYEFFFSSHDDMRRLWSSGSWSLGSGTLRLLQWSADFNPNKQKQSHVQCWVRLYDLPQEHWRPKILFEIANGIGTPIAIDEATKSRSLGHLVEIDLSKSIPYDLRVERNDHAFFVSIDYEKLSFFCGFCQMIGHELAKCKRKMVDQTQSSKKNKGQQKPIKVGKVFIPKKIVQQNKPEEGKVPDIPDPVAENQQVSGHQIDQNVKVVDGVIGLPHIDIVPDRDDKEFEIPRDELVSADTVLKRMI